MKHFDSNYHYYLAIFFICRFLRQIIVISRNVKFYQLCRSSFVLIQKMNYREVNTPSIKKKVLRMTLKKQETSLLLSGRDKKYAQSAVNPIIQRTSSVIFDSVAQKREATKKRAEGTLFYGRRGTTTHFALQEALTELEQGAGCALFLRVRQLLHSQYSRLLSKARIFL